MTSGHDAGPLFGAALPSVQGEPSGRIPKTPYRYVWKVSVSQQIRLCLLTFVVFPFSMAPLELQRRIINDTVEDPNFDLLLLLGGAYLLVLFAHGGLKYIRNLYQGTIS